MNIISKKEAVIETFQRALYQSAFVLKENPELTFPQIYNRAQWMGEKNTLLKNKLETEEKKFKKPWLQLLNGLPIQQSLILTIKGEDNLVVSALSPDGKKIVSSGTGEFRDEWIRPVIRIWETETGKEIAVIQNHADDIIRGLTFTPDGRKILSVSMGRVTVRSADRGEMILEFDTHFQGGIYRYLHRILSPCGQRIVAGASDGTIRIIDIETGEIKVSFQGYQGATLCCIFSPDGKHILSLGADGEIKLWDVRSKKQLWSTAIFPNKQYLSPNSYVESCAFSPNGTRIAVVEEAGQYRNTIKLLDAESGREIEILKGHQSNVSDFIFSSDSLKIASVGKDGLLFTWDARTGKELGESCSYNLLSACTFSPDDRLIVTACGDHLFMVPQLGDFHLWDAATLKKISTLTAHSSDIWDCKYSSDGKMLLSTGADGQIKLWEAALLELAGIPDKHKQSITTCRFSHDGRWILSSSDDADLKVWNSISFELLFTLSGHEGQVLDCWFTPYGQNILSSNLNEFFVWEVAQRTIKVKLDKIRATCFTISPDGRVLACCEGAVVQCLDLENLARLKTFEVQEDRIRACAFSPDGNIILTGGKGLSIWDYESGLRIMDLDGHKGQVLACAISPEGREILSAGRDGNLCLWNSKTGERVTILQGHTGAVNHCSFSPDGKKAVSGGGDGTLRLWDLTEGRQILSFKGFTGGIQCCSFSPNGSKILVGDIRGQILLVSTKNIESIEPIVTSIRFRVDDRQIKWDEKIKTTCSWCGKRFPVAERILDLIRSINKNAGITPDQSPILHLPDEAWDEPGLISECPKCRGKLKYNPFIVDNRDESDFKKGDTSKKKKFFLFKREKIKSRPKKRDRKSRHFENKFIVSNKTGLDARTTAKICNILNKIEADCYLEYKDDKINLKEALGLLTLGITRSDIITIICEGKMDKDINTLFAPLIDEGLLTPVVD